MSATTKARAAALARVCRLALAARRHGQASVDLAQLEHALEGVDVEGLAVPRPSVVSNVGRPVRPPGVTSHTPTF